MVQTTGIRQAAYSGVDGYAAAAVRVGDDVAAVAIAAVDRVALRLHASDDVIALSYSGTMGALAAWCDAHAGQTPTHSLVGSMASRIVDRRQTDGFNAARRLRAVEVVSLDALTLPECDAIEARLLNREADNDAMAAVPLAEGFGGGHRAMMALSLVEAYSAATSAGHGGAVAIVQGVTSDAWARRHRDVTRGEAEAADIRENFGRDALHYRRASGAVRALPFLPLRVSVVAAASGFARPRTAAASLALREAAYSSAALVMSFMAPWYSVGVLTDAVRSYCLQERRAFGGNGLAVWNREARPAFSVAPRAEVLDATGAVVVAASKGVPLAFAAYAPRSSFTPELDTFVIVKRVYPEHDSVSRVFVCGAPSFTLRGGTRSNVLLVAPSVMGPLRLGEVDNGDGTTGQRVRRAVAAPFQRVQGFKVGTSGKGRKGAPAGQVGLGVMHGGAGGAYSSGDRAAWSGAHWWENPSRSDAPVMPEVSQTRDNVAARAASRADDAATAHGDADDTRARGSVCGSFVVTAEGALCQCGALTGAALLLVPVFASAPPVGVAVPDFGALVPVREVVGYSLVHPLALCVAPVVSRDGVTRCGCGSRRGVLSESGAHRRRVNAGRSMV